MILICVGASEYKLDRLLGIVDELCDEGFIDGNEIIAQIGQTDYKPRNYKSFNLIGREDFQQYIEKADLIITHAGTGSVIPPLKMGKKIIVFPRKEMFHEHLDDHQMELMEVFTEAGYTLSAETKEELIEAINKSSTFIPKEFKSNNARINKLVIDYIESL